MSNKEGVEFTWPLRYRWVFPRDEKYRLSVGSPSERTLKLVMIGLAAVLFLFHLIGPRSILHRILATPSAASTEYYQQLMRDHRVEAKISGVWTKSQKVLEKQSFEIIAADSFAVYVRKKDVPKKVYCVSDSPISSISHAKIKVEKKERAKQKVLILSFSKQKWNKTLALRFPKSIVSGKITTTADFPTFDIDEFLTVRQVSIRKLLNPRVSGYWELLYTLIELLDKLLKEHTLTGKIHVRYWED